MDAAVIKHRHMTFVRNSRAAVVVWVTLSALLTILVFTTLLVPHWLGHGPGAFTTGHIGLYQRCFLDGSTPNCRGAISDLGTITNEAFRGATVLMVLACCLCILCLVAVPLMFIFSSWKVLAAGGLLQVIVAILIFITCLVFPSGWDDASVRELCGPSAGKFRMGGCRMRWAFPLAILSLFDAAAVASLALLLAHKLFKLVPDVSYRRSKLQYNSDRYLVDDDQQSMTSSTFSPAINGARRRSDSQMASHHL